MRLLQRPGAPEAGVTPALQTRGPEMSTNDALPAGSFLRWRLAGDYEGIPRFLTWLQGTVRDLTEDVFFKDFYLPLGVCRVEARSLGWIVVPLVPLRVVRRHRRSRRVRVDVLDAPLPEHPDVAPIAETRRVFGARQHASLSAYQLSPSRRPKR